MITFPELTVYITHTCDLACDECFTYNNLNWGGHFDIDTNVESLRGVVTFDEVFIIGGEPTLHPNLSKWMEWVEYMWPTSKKWIVTNGRNMNNIIWRQGWHVELSAHSPNDLVNILKWLDLNSIKYNKFYDDRHSDAVWHYRLTKDDIEVGELSESWNFFKASTILQNNQPLSWTGLEDKHIQHQLCPSKDCLHLLNGRFYRCPQQALLPQVSNNFVIDPRYKEIATKDVGCNPNEFLEWIDTRNIPQDHCSLCSWDQKVTLPNESKIKKIKIMKI